MLFKKIKQIITSIVVGATILLACIGGHEVYRAMNPVPVVQTETKTMQVKLESMGVFKSASSEKDVTKEVQKGTTKLYKTTYRLKHRYKACYEYDLKDILIRSEINNKEVVMEIDPNKLYIGELIVVNDTEDMETSLVAPIIDSRILQEARKEMREVVLKEFKADENFKQFALLSLKDKLYKLAEDLGFEKISIIIKE